MADRKPIEVKGDRVRPGSAEQLPITSPAGPHTHLLFRPVLRAACGGMELHAGERCRALGSALGPLASSESTLSRFWCSQNGIEKLIRLLEGQPEDQFSAEQYMNLYT